MPEKVNYCIGQTFNPYKQEGQICKFYKCLTDLWQDFNNLHIIVQNDLELRLQILSLLKLI